MEIEQVNCGPTGQNEELCGCGLNPNPLKAEFVGLGCYQFKPKIKFVDKLGNKNRIKLLRNKRMPVSL